MESIESIYEHLKSKGVLTGETTLYTFAQKMADKEARASFYKVLTESGVALNDEAMVFFGKKKAQAEPSQPASEPGFPDFSEISSSQNAPAPTAIDSSTFEPVFKPEAPPPPNAEPWDPAQPTEGPSGVAVDQNGFEGLPSNLIPDSAPRDATLPQLQVNRGEVKPTSISGSEDIATYSANMPERARKDKRQDASPNMETPMSSGATNPEAEAAMVYGEDARRQADIAATQLEMAFGKDWRRTAPASDPDRIKFDAAIKAQMRAYDHYQAHTGGTILDGTEDPVAFGENRRKNLPSYDYKKTYDSKTAIRKERRQLDNIAEYGEAARFQSRYADTLLKEKYGENWLSDFESVSSALQNNKVQDPELFARYYKFANDPIFLQWVKAAEAQNKGYEAFKAKLDGSPAIKQRLIDAAAAQDASNRLSEERPGPEALGLLVNPFMAAKADPLSKNWLFRKSAQLVGAAASLPRTVGRAVTGKEDGWLPADEIGSWADELVEEANVSYPKPEQLSRPLYERVTSFNGNEAVVDDKGKLLSIRDKDGNDIEITPESKKAFEASGAADKAKERFNGGVSTADKVLDAAADLMLYRFMGGGTQPGVVASSFLMQHQQAYKEASEQMNMSAGDAAQYALVSSTLTGVLEAYLGTIETKFATPEVVAAVKAGKQEAMALVGKRSGAELANVAMKPVIKEVIGENTEEFLQAVSENMTRAAYNNMTGANLESGMTAQDMKETALVTTLLTAPAASLGMSAHVESNRRSALLAAAKDVNGFSAVLSQLEANRAITPEEASEMKARIERLSELNASLPVTMPDEERSHVLALQEFSDARKADAAAEGTVPAMAAIAKDEAGEADAIIESMVKGEKQNPTEAPPPPPEQPKPKTKKVSSVVIEPTDTKEESDGKKSEVLTAAVQALESKGHTVAAEEIPAVEDFFVPTLTEAPLPSQQDAPVEETVDNLATEYMDENGIQPSAGFTQASVINRDYAFLKEKMGEKGVKNYFKQADRLIDPNKNEIVEYRYAGVVVKKGEWYSFIPFVDTDMKSWRLGKPWDVSTEVAASEYGLDEKQSAAYESELPAMTEKVAALSAQDIQDAADFIEEMGGDVERVIASVNGAIEEMDRKAFEALKAKNRTVHQLFLDELSTEQPVAVPGSGEGKENGILSEEAGQTQALDESQGVDVGQEVKSAEIPGSQDPGEPNPAGGIELPETATPEGAVFAAQSGVIPPGVAIASIAGDETAQKAVVDSASKIVESANTDTDIYDAVEGADFQALPEQDGDMGPLSPSVFVVRGDMVYVAKYEGYEDILRAMGGNFVPGKGWAFPAIQRWAVAAAMKRTAKASSADKSNRKGSGADGRVAAALGDKDILATAKKTEKAIAEGKTLAERVAAAKQAIHVQDEDRKMAVERTIERLKAAFPNITVVTDPELIKDALHKLRIKDAPAGFTHEGKVYIDMELAGIDTPIHEFGHIWSSFLKATSPKVHQAGLEAVKGTEYEAIVRSDERYAYLDEEADVLDEALSQAIGERGARLGEQSDWLAFKSFMAKAKKAINKLLGFDPMKMSAKQFADTMAAKMLSGEELMTETSEDIAKLEKGVKFLFAGSEKAEISDSVRSDLEAARYMEKAGMSPREIWVATNWWRGPDGHWKWEVSDKGAEIVVEPSLIADGEVVRLRDVMSHPELYKAYPAIADAGVLFTRQEDEMWDASLAMTKDKAIYFMVNLAHPRSRRGLKHSLLHEAQHAVQYSEGFGMGMSADPRLASAVLESNLADAVDKKDTERIKMLFKAVNGAVSDLYRRASGEVESRNVETRAEMEEPTFPEDTMDVSPAEQTVLFMTDAAFDKIVHGFDGSRAAPKAKFQHASNTLREASLRAAARQLVDIEVKSGGTPKDKAVPFIAAELGLDEAVVGQMWEESAYKHAPKNIIAVTSSEVKKTASSISDKLGRWARKWLGTYRGLPPEVFRSTVDMQREISAEMYRASKLGDDLSKALKKYPPEMAGVVQNVLEGASEWSLLPPDLAPYAMAVRDSVDSLSRKLLLSGAVKKGSLVKVMENMGVSIDPENEGLVDDIEEILGKPPLERTDEENEMVDEFLSTHKERMGTYLNRSYRAHQYKDWGDKTPDGFKRVPPEAVDQARKFFIGQLQGEYKKLVDSLAKKEDVAAKKAAKISKLIADNQKALAQPDLDPEEVISRSAEIGALEKQLEALEKGIMADREKIAEEMDIVSAKLGNVDDVIANYLYGQKTESSMSPTDIAGKKNESILSRREDVPAELRALLGEYRDPVVNYATTVAKIAHLMAAQNFLSTMATKYGGIYFHKSQNAPAGNYVQVSMENDPAFGPIDGWWTTPDILEALKDMRSPDVVSLWEKNWAVYFVQRVKLGKTILSPITHARNFVGNIAFAVMNGWNPVAMYDAFKELAPMFNGGDKAPWRSYAEKLHRLGVFGESVSAGDLEALRTYASWDKGAGEVERYATFIEKAMSAPTKVYDAAKKGYEVEDNFYRMMAFENEKRRYAKAWHGKAFSELSQDERARVEEKAAAIVAHILPTYSYVPKLVQAVRRAPFVGTFVAFPSEMVRVAYNNLEMAVQEMKDTRTRSLGVRRLMGAALVHSAEFWLLELAKSWAGYDDDEWENANKFVPPFERNGALLPLPRDNKGQMGYINLSYTNPYSFVPKAYRAFAANPKDTVAKSTVDAVGSLLDPFLSPELSFMAVNQLFMNQDDWGRPIRQDAFEGPLGSKWLAPENIDAQMRFLANKLQPGIVKSVRDAYDIQQQNPSRSGKVKSWDTFALSHTLGLSVQRIDPTFSYSSQMYRLTDQKNQARKNYTAAQKRYNAGYQTVLRENPDDTALIKRKDAEFKAAMKSEYEVTKAAYARILQDAVDLTQALRKLGLSDATIRANMAGFSNEEKSAILAGQTRLQLTFKRKGRY